MKKVILLVLILFLVGCVSEEIKKVKNESVVVNKTKVVDNVPASKCEAGWKCLGKWKKSYLASDCQWSNETSCPLGCEKGKCNVGKVCSSGFKCIDKNKKGYQTENCGWINTKKCPGGCLKGECLPEPEKNETNITNEVKSSAIDDSTEQKPKETIYTTTLTETTNLTFNKKNYLVEVYNLESDRVKIKINGARSDWLSEGQNHSYQGQITLTIKEILYQRYGGGKQQVGYTLK